MNQHVTMPSEVQEYYNAINQYQPEAFIGLFAEEAVVRDNGKQIQGKEAIEAWGEAELFSAKVRFTINEIEESGGSIAVTAEMEGEFNRNRVPAPQLFRHEFQIRNGKISSLVVTQK
ncbi:nuclear transport factor 2 family protein [Paenibacillus typhae]|uniref:SnoaL-like domain-containing protein n=1 Tax=Paenibacillus typhae TaxID=1174501 RepID=A0A1G8VKS8_9BACL|nr:nuclear transport factor 2 family protein [Paenibacillus typhae]SDJ66688.1 SnoaL-like domain-containing protein [Paenibacillus typhae]